MRLIKSKTKPVADPKTPHRFEFEAIGTSWIIDFFNSNISESRLVILLDKIMTRIDRFDKAYSRFRDDSTVTKISKKPGKYALPDDASKLLDLYQKLYDITGGKVTPLIGNVISEAGYDAEYSLKKSKPTTPDEKPVLLDFGAAGKGYLVDIIVELLVAEGMLSFCVNAGGDLVYQTNGVDSVSVGLEHPSDHSLAVGVAKIYNQSICGSSGSRRKWAEYHHIIDPHTLESPQHVLATWVVADTALVADGLATALYFVDAETLHGFFDFEYAMLRADGTLSNSTNFPAEFFSK